MITVAITGGSGSMGKDTVEYVLSSDKKFFVRLLFLPTLKDRAFERKLKRKYKDRVEILFGDIRSYEDCLRLTEGADYVLHIAALIPPKADHDEKRTVETNYNGTVNLVNAVIENGKGGKEAKFVHISTVATYGNRDEKHPWGRVGDPLLTSMYDVYGTSKTRGERYVLDSDLKTWAILRQSGILYDNMLMNNIKDGLMFHTCWNMPIEWATAKDSGVLMQHILEADVDDLAKNFWKRVYNIGGGKKARQTGYETFDDGFKLIGGSVKSFFKPEWNATRNFHCMWYADSDELEEMFRFRSQGCEDFWKWFHSRHKLYGAAKILPPALIRDLVIKPLLKNNNSPFYWRKHGMKGRVFACYGKEMNVMTDWNDLLCEREDYEELKKEPKNLLSHGYDETKPTEELDIADMKDAALFRGGECVTSSMKKGDLYTKIEWKCHNGHRFFASPYTVLKAGHWCPECCLPDREWNFDALAKNIPFYAQLWYDTHEENENVVYKIADGVATHEEIND